MQNKLLSGYFFFVFLLTAQPCNFFNITDVGSATTIAITLLLSAFICIRFKTVKFEWKRFIGVTALMALWGLLQYVFLDRSPSPLIFVELFVAFVVFHLYRNNLVYRFEIVSVKMAIIALGLWGICLFAYEPMYALAKAIGDKGAGVSQSLYIFSIPNRYSYQGFLLRNCGYSWEPGRFSCMLIIALWFNILRTNLNFKDRNFRILTLALITAQSTTGYIVYILMIGIYYLIYKKWNPLYIAAGALAISSIMALPFMREKIENLMLTNDDLVVNLQNMEYQARSNSFEGLYVPQRFEGFMYQLVNFEHSNKIIGEGRNFLNFYINKELGFPVVVSEGIVNIFIRYGIIIALLMCFCLFSSSRAISSRYEGRGRLLFPLLFLSLSFSYYLWASPILMVVWLWSYWDGSVFNKYKKLKCNKNSKTT